MKFLPAVAAALGILGTNANADSPKPNVLFLFIDDLRPELGSYGYETIKSPNIDRLAAEGLLFKRAYCQQAVCSPSRSSLLTGARPDTTQVWDLVTHFRKAMPDEATLPQHFKNNGYFVQGVGKIYHSPEFDDTPSWSEPWAEPKRPEYALPENLKIAAEKYAQAIQEGKEEKAAQSLGRGAAFESADVPDNYYYDGALADMAITALEKIKEQKQPFWLGVGFKKPHLPYVAPKKYWDMYNPKEIALAPNPYRPKDAPDYSIVSGQDIRYYDGIPKGHIPDDLARMLKHGYFASISYMDAQVGRVMEAADRLGLLENTIVVLWGDHGWKLGEHDAWCKHSNCELDTRVPLIISAPGRDRGKTVNAFVECVDIYPTLAELCGLPLPAHLEGVSMLPLLQDPAREFRRAAFSQFPRKLADGRRLMGYSMRTDRYRFTVWLDRDEPSKIDAIELYDEESDPQENLNIANLPENKALVSQLMEQWKNGWQGAAPAAVARR